MSVLALPADPLAYELDSARAKTRHNLVLPLYAVRVILATRRLHLLAPSVLLALIQAEGKVLTHAQIGKLVNREHDTVAEALAKLLEANIIGSSERSRGFDAPAGCSYRTTGWLAGGLGLHAKCLRHVYSHTIKDLLGLQIAFDGDANADAFRQPLQNLADEVQLRIRQSLASLAPAAAPLAAQALKTNRRFEPTGAEFDVLAAEERRHLQDLALDLSQLIAGFAWHYILSPRRFHSSVPHEAVPALRLLERMQKALENPDASSPAPQVGGDDAFYDHDTFNAFVGSQVRIGHVAVHGLLLLPPSVVCTALAFELHAPRIHPTLAQLAEESHLSKPTIKKAIAQLLDLGMYTVTAEGGRPGVATEYRKTDWFGVAQDGFEISKGLEVNHGQLEMFYASNFEAQFAFLQRVVSCMNQRIDSPEFPWLKLDEQQVADVIARLGRPLPSPSQSERNW